MPSSPEKKHKQYLDRKARDWPKMQAVAAVWRDNNRDHLKSRDSQRRLEKRALCLVNNARTRARRRGLPFDLGPDDVTTLQAIIDRGHCELSGIAFTLTGGRKATSPSLDRIKPVLGYVPGNIRVICQALNAALGDWGEIELRLIVEAWVNNKKEQV